MLRDYALIITGCVDPDSSVPFLQLKDKTERAKQYIDSIHYYIEKTSIASIVFCDNSGTRAPEHLFELAQKYSKRFEWISFLGDKKKSVEQGKGYGEGEIIEYALSHSSILKSAGYIVKVTGRVVIRNINLLLRFMREDRIYFLRNTANNVDTKLYGMPILTYQHYFSKLYLDVDDLHGRYLENKFSDAIIKNGIHIDPFIVFPNAQGISGSTGQPYTIPIINRIKQTIKIHMWR